MIDSVKFCSSHCFVDVAFTHIWVDPQVDNITADACCNYVRVSCLSLLSPPGVQPREDF